MPNTARFVENPGWPLEVYRSTRARLTVEVIGERVKESIISKVPVVTGAYKASFESGTVAEPAEGPLGQEVHIHMGDPRWHIIEFGNAKYAGAPNPPYAPVRRGVIAAGLVFVKE